MHTRDGIHPFSSEVVSFRAGDCWTHLGEGGNAHLAAQIVFLSKLLESRGRSFQVGDAERRSENGGWF
jgi:hypothetical protein